MSTTEHLPLHNGALDQLRQENNAYYVQGRELVSVFLKQQWAGCESSDEAKENTIIAFLDALDLDADMEEDISLRAGYEKLQTFIDKMNEIPAEKRSSLTQQDFEKNKKVLQQYTSTLIPLCFGSLDELSIVAHSFETDLGDELDDEVLSVYQSVQFRYDQLLEVQDWMESVEDTIVKKEANTHAQRTFSAVDNILASIGDEDDEWDKLSFQEEYVAPAVQAKVQTKKIPAHTTQSALSQSEIVSFDSSADPLAQAAELITAPYQQEIDRLEQDKIALQAQIDKLKQQSWPTTVVQEKTITVEKKVLTESAKGVIKSSPLWKELEQSLSDDQKENITDDQMIRLIAAVQKFAVKEPVENILDENKLKALLPKIRKKIGF